MIGALFGQERRHFGRGARHFGRAPGHRLAGPRPQAHLGGVARPAGSQVHGEVRAHHVLRARLTSTPGDVQVAEGAVHRAGRGVCGRPALAGAALSVALEQDTARVAAVVGRLHEVGRARMLGRGEVLLAHAAEELAVRGGAVDGALGRRACKVSFKWVKVIPYP